MNRGRAAGRRMYGKWEATIRSAELAGANRYECILTWDKYKRRLNRNRHTSTQGRRNTQRKMEEEWNVDPCRQICVNHTYFLALPTGKSQKHEKPMAKRHICYPGLGLQMQLSAKKLGLLESMTLPRLGQGMCQRSLEHLTVRAASTREPCR